MAALVTGDRQALARLIHRQRRAGQAAMGQRLVEEVGGSRVAVREHAGAQAFGLHGGAEKAR